MHIRKSRRTFKLVFPWPDGDASSWVENRREDTALDRAERTPPAGPWAERQEDVRIPLKQTPAQDREPRGSVCKERRCKIDHVFGFNTRWHKCTAESQDKPSQEGPRTDAGTEAAHLAPWQRRCALRKCRTFFRCFSASKSPLYFLAGLKRSHPSPRRSLPGNLKGVKKKKRH